jgi:hypothetical protein
MPDYVDITYDIRVYTDYITQNNKVVEAIQYAENSYWGDPESYNFRTIIDTFTLTTEYQKEEDRVVRTDMSMKLMGYLIPDTINKDLSYNSLVNTKAQLVFVGEVVSSIPTTNQIVNNKTTKRSTTNSTGNPYDMSAANLSQITTYLNTNTPSHATYINDYQVELVNATILLAPAILPPTSKVNFTVLINGLNVDYSYFDLRQVGSNIIFTFNISASGLGYPILPTDDVVIVGKYT